METRVNLIYQQIERSTNVVEIDRLLKTMGTLYSTPVPKKSIPKPNTTKKPKQKRETFGKIEIGRDLENGIHMIYSDSCGACRVAKPKITQLQEKYPSLVFMYDMKDATINKGLRKDFKVRYYPFMVMSINKETYLYRDTLSIVKIEEYFTKYKLI
tara:strand:- start:203 stop:670 length:468 start_codon:yes stop_codon:yes gene_type:complete